MAHELRGVTSIQTGGRSNFDADAASDLLAAAEFESHSCFHSPGRDWGGIAAGAFEIYQSAYMAGSSRQTRAGIRTLHLLGHAHPLGLPSLNGDSCRRRV